MRLKMTTLKIKKDARKKLNIVKQNVEIEASKNIVKELEKAIFGYDDKGDDDKGDDDKGDDDGKQDDYEESIGEGVKLKNQNKTNYKYTTKYPNLNRIDEKFLGEEYVLDDGTTKYFEGFKNIIDEYENGIINYDTLLENQEKYLNQKNTTHMMATVLIDYFIKDLIYY